MQITFSNLVLEVTRKCNMNCPHCLRGPAQRVEMDLEIINRITTQTSFIHTLTISGGEPSLAGRTINHLRWALYFNNCELSQFWMTVNARFFKKDFYDALWELYDACYDKDNCVLTISGDQYHSAMSRVAFDKYSELPFFNTSRMQSIEDHMLLSEGRAAKYQMGYREVEVQKTISDYCLDDELYIGDTIYINAKGDVILCCDLSYISQKKHSLGNVLQEPLEQILMRNLKLNFLSA